MAGGDFPTGKVAPSIRPNLAVIQSSLMPPLSAGVWSPAGGWFADPKHWRRNTAICFLVIGAIAVPVLWFSLCCSVSGLWSCRVRTVQCCDREHAVQVFLKSAQLEVHHTYPSRPIPSQRWCKNFPKPPQEDAE